MKALKIIGGVVLALVLAVGVFYVGWLRAPSAEEVCDNLAAVTKTETGKELGAKGREVCIEHAQPPKYGRVPWVKRMKCLRDASSLKAIEACSNR
jgi:hypothetical protein